MKIKAVAILALLCCTYVLTSQSTFFPFDVYFSSFDNEISESSDFEIKVKLGRNFKTGDHFGLMNGTYLEEDGGQFLAENGSFVEYIYITNIGNTILSLGELTIRSN